MWSRNVYVFTAYFELYVSDNVNRSYSLSLNVTSGHQILSSIIKADKVQNKFECGHGVFFYKYVDDFRNTC